MRVAGQPGKSFLVLAVRLHYRISVSISEKRKKEREEETTGESKTLNSQFEGIDCVQPERFL